MASWIDDFEGNKLSSKWVPTRYSQGGQNDGVWRREIKDSKVYWVAVSQGTEGNRWGEILTLPVNAPGDIIIEAPIRCKNAANYGQMGIGVNHALYPSWERYGVTTYNEGIRYVFGSNVGTWTSFPGFPSKTYMGTYPTTDYSSIFKVKRKNGYIFLYADEKYLGSYAYAPTITTVDIIAWWNAIGVEHWIDWIKVTPSSVVL